MLFKKKEPPKYDEESDYNDYIKFYKEVIPQFVLLKIVPGYEHSVYKKIEKIAEKEGWIEQIYPIMGEYDFIIKFYCSRFHTIDVVTQKLRSIEGSWKAKMLTAPSFEI